MPNKPPSHNAKQVEQNRKQYEKQRGSSRQRGYTHAWDEAAREYKRLHPWCVRCQAKGIWKPVKVVGHVKPADLFPELFWEIETNWISLCVACNAAQAIEDARLYGHR